MLRLFLTQCRQKSTLNVKKPQAAHLDRRLLEAVTLPFFPKDLYEPEANCPRLKRRLREENPDIERSEENRYEQYLVRRCTKMFEENQMIVVFQPMLMSRRDQRELYVKLHKHNLHLVSFGNQIVKSTIKDSKYRNLLPLIQSHNTYIVSPERNVAQLVKSTQKIPEIVMLGGIVGDRMLSKQGLLDYANLPDLSTLQGQLVGILNMASNRTRTLLSQHQEALSRNLEQHIKDNTPADIS